MTLHELLEKVSFDELLPHLLRYDKRLRGVAAFKTHYDILRHLSPIGRSRLIFGFLDYYMVN